METRKLKSPFPLRAAPILLNVCPMSKYHTPHQFRLRWSARFLHLPSPLAESLAGRRGQGSPGLSGAFAWLRPHGPHRPRNRYRSLLASSSPMRNRPTRSARRGFSRNAAVRSIPKAVANLNASIAGYHHKDEVRKTILDANGISDDGTILDAINLNNLDDWLGFHKEVIVGLMPRRAGGFTRRADRRRRDPPADRACRIVRRPGWR